MSKYVWRYGEDGHGHKAGDYHAIALTSHDSCGTQNPHRAVIFSENRKIPHLKGDWVPFADAVKEYTPEMNAATFSLAEIEQAQELINGIVSGRGDKV